MFEIVLVAPEIPGNTGAIIRLCANTGARLHLVEPLGFSLEAAQLKRAGLDYHDLALMTVWDNFNECRTNVGNSASVWYATTGKATRHHTDVDFAPIDVVVFGCESTGLDDDALAQFAPNHRIRIPMQPNNRSLNLSNAAAVVVYEAWRQHGFAGAS